MLALYNRLGTILARIRAFHQQKIESLMRHQDHDDADHSVLLDMLASQIGAVIGKGQSIPKSLSCLLAANTAFLLSSLLAGATSLHERFGVVALGTCFLGSCLFLFGLGLAMRELALSISPLQEQSEFLNVLVAR